MVTFREATDVNAMPPNYAAHIMGYAYNSEGAAHTVRLVMAPGVAGNADEEILLEAPTSTLSSFTNLCGSDGIIVPRIFGLNDVAQPPAVTTTVGTTYQVLFSTTDKDGAATFSLWYKIGPVA